MKPGTSTANRCSIRGSGHPGPRDNSASPLAVPRVPRPWNTTWYNVSAGQRRRVPPFRVYHVISGSLWLKHSNTLAAPLHPETGMCSSFPSSFERLCRSHCIYLTRADIWNSASSWVQTDLHPAPQGADFGHARTSNLHPLTGGA